jgi:hypothetical protein
VRRAAKTDANHDELIQTFRAAGCTVTSTHAVGGGFPDAVVGLAGQNALVEFKDPTKPPSARRLTPDQKRWHAEWKGKAHVIETVEQALQLVAYMRGRLVRP